MKIRTITVYGLFGECDCGLSLNQGPLTFIYSQNGFGKSTVTRALAAAFRGEFETLAAMPFERMDICFSNDTALIIENYSEFSVQIQKNEIEQYISAEETRSLMPVTYIPPERQIVRKNDGRTVPAISVYSAELRDRIRFAKENSELTLPDSVTETYTDGELIDKCRDLKAKLDFMSGAGIAPDMPPGLRFPPERHDLGNKKERYERLVPALEEYIKKYYLLAESVVVFKDIINSLYIRKTIELSEKDNLNVRLDSGKDLPLMFLSSGEKQIFVLFYRMLFQTDPGALVILDEPEISLHVEWQQRLGSILADVAKLRDLQILIATHSPQIIHDKWDMARELKPEYER